MIEEFFEKLCNLHPRNILNIIWKSIENTISLKSTSFQPLVLISQNLISRVIRRQVIDSSEKLICSQSYTEEHLEALSSWRKELTKLGINSFSRIALQTPFLKQSGPALSFLPRLSFASIFILAVGFWQHRSLQKLQIYWLGSHIHIRCWKPMVLTALFLKVSNSFIS